MEWYRSENGKYRIESLTAATFPGALNVIKECFFTEEKACIGTEVNINPAAIEELLELCADTALDGVSVVAVEISSGDVVAACFNKLLVSTKNSAEKPFYDAFEERCKHPSSKAMAQFMAEVEVQCNFFQKFNVDCSLEIMFLATLHDHRRQNLGWLLCKATLDVGRKLKDGPVSHITVQSLGPKYSRLEPRTVTTKVPSICQSLASSVATQKIGKSLGFTVHWIISLKKFEYNGKSYFDRVGYDSHFVAIVRPLE